MKAFLSRCLDKSADKFCDSVKKILSEFNIYCETYGKEISSLDSLKDGITEEIKNSDLVVCCLTKVIVSSDGRYYPTSANYVENGIAQNYAIPTLFFVEKDVEVSNIISSSTTYIITDGTLKDLREKQGLISSMLQKICLAKGRYEENAKTPANINLYNNTQIILVNDNGYTISLLLLFGVLFVIGLTYALNKN